jgi:hypothetical protein
MDREKAIDWIYGERLIQPIAAKPPSAKRTVSEEEEHHTLLWILRHRFQSRYRLPSPLGTKPSGAPGGRAAAHEAAWADTASTRSRSAEQIASRAPDHKAWHYRDRLAGGQAGLSNGDTDLAGQRLDRVRSAKSSMTRSTLAEGSPPRWRPGGLAERCSSENQDPRLGKQA